MQDKTKEDLYGLNKHGARTVFEVAAESLKLQSKEEVGHLIECQVFYDAIHKLNLKYDVVTPERIAHVFSAYILHELKKHKGLQLKGEEKVDRMISNMKKAASLISDAEPILKALVAQGVQYNQKEKNELKEKTREEDLVKRFEEKLVNEFYNFTQAAKVMGLGAHARKTVMGWVKSGKVRAIDHGERKVILKDDLISAYKQYVLKITD